LKEIIDRIVSIDASAYETEQRNKDALAGERKKLENDMERYRTEVLTEAKKKADVIYSEIKNEADEECRLLQEKNKRLADRISARYEELEDAVLGQVLSKLLGG